MQEDIVVFKGKKDLICISLNSEIDFEKLKIIFTEKIIDAKLFFGKAKTSIKFTGRNLNHEQEQQLLDIIKSKCELTIVLVAEKKGKIKRAEDIKNKKPKEKIVIKIKNIESNIINEKENITLFNEGGLRSGQVIDYDGSVVIYGDVNPGAFVSATGNIMVFGVARGNLHAGCKGNDKCTVSAVCLIPVQLRIASCITYIPTDVVPKSSDKMKQSPSVAFIKDSNIYIQPIS